METSTPVLSFYSTSTAHPLTLRLVLTAHLDLDHGTLHTISTLPTHQEFTRAPPAVPVPSTAQSSTPQANTHPKPYHNPTRIQRTTTPAPPTQMETLRGDSEDGAGSEAGSGESLGSEPDDDEMDEESSDEQAKIAKPEGQASRPGGGGYNLEDALNWNGTTYSKLRKYMNRLVGDHLDQKKTYSLQDPRGIRIVSELAMAKFPDLRKYRGCWPVLDLIKVQLKYTSRRARLREVKEAAAAKPSEA